MARVLGPGGVLVAGFFDPLRFSHTLADQIGGQGRAGLHVTDLLEDHRPRHPLAPHLPTRAVRQALDPGTGPAVPR